MIRYFVLLLCLSFSTIQTELPPRPTSSAVTYRFGAGRFGDQMLTYLHAKWASYCYKLPFYFKPFPHSSKLVLHDADPLLTDEIIKSYDKVVRFRQWSDLDSHHTANILYSIKYFPECLIDLRNAARRRRYFKVDWEDPGFKKEVRRLVAPKNPTKQVTLPHDCTTIAVHVRKGGGYDSLRRQRGYPLKFPTDQYYIDQIKRIDEILGHQPLHAYIFTDDAEPWKIAENFRRAINESHITIDCHTPEQKKAYGLIDDLFAMTQCDCLIRAESHFSVLAGKLKDFTLEICPLSHHRENGAVVIDEVTVKSRLSPDGVTETVERNRHTEDMDRLD